MSHPVHPILCNVTIAALSMRVNGSIQPSILPNIDNSERGVKEEEEDEQEEGE
jgi:hypothetical protein